MTYEGMLTASSIQMAQKYYDLIMKVKNGETTDKSDETPPEVLTDNA